MPFRSDTAADTLLKTVQALQAAWAALPAPARADVQGAIMAHGPKIAAANSFTAPAAITQFLDALWAARGALPAGAVQALTAGQAPAPATNYRSAPSVSADRHKALLASLVALADFRLFDNPKATAEAVVRLVAAHDDRLTEAERADWLKLYDAWARGGDPNEFLRGVEALLGCYPAVKALLANHKTFVLPTEVIFRGAELKGVNLPKAVIGPIAHALMESAAPAPGATVVRFANVYFPATIQLTQKDVPLIVHVAQKHSTKSVISEAAGEITLQVGDLTIVIQAEGFDVTEQMGGRPAGDAPGRVVTVQPDRDCEPVVFLLTPQSVGEKRINVAIDQFGRTILTQAIQVRVVAALDATSNLSNAVAEPTAVASPTRGKNAPPPDLELRVMLSGDKRKLSFMLHGGATYNYRPVGETDLETTDPRGYFQTMLNRLSALSGRAAATRTADETAAIKQELATLGNNLYEKLFPEQFKVEYGKVIRTKFEDKSLLITSDDPWIPWEIVRPFAVDENGEILYDDEPLCERFRVSRWLIGRGTPDQLFMKEGTWVAPPGSAPEADVENRYFQELHRRQWQVSLSGPLAKSAEVQTRLQAKNTQLFHFACHGSFDASIPNDSMIKLADGFFKPGQIVDPRTRAGLTAAKPLVFLNACHSGEIGFELTDLGGWAKAFFDSGVSAFIGSLWEINGKLAARFAQEFYNRLWGINGFEGKAQPLGQAFHEARMVIKELDEANPTWLAYVLYGDPYGQVVLGNP
jgi:hypothetical protein